MSSVLLALAMASRLGYMTAVRLIIDERGLY